MRQIDFPIVRDDYQIIGEAVRRPMLVVERFNSARRSGPLLALVDSGADISMFHIDVGSRIGIDYAQCRRSGAVGVGGRTTTYVCPIELEVEGRRFPIDARFTTGLPATTALLGRADVFAQFRFGFDQRAHLLLIEPY